VVDDDAAVRSTVGTLLRAIGHTVIEAADGASALRLLDEAAPEIVLTDLGMPEMNGWELAARIKARHPMLPVVLLTGWHDQALAEPAASQAVDRVVEKPFRLEVLRKTITDLAVKPRP
jgi:CheY-like chemotaxis protein